MTPHSSQPSGDLGVAIRETFGSVEGLKTSFIAQGVGHFGSGWVWLIADGPALSIITTHDGDTALLHTGVPLLVCDLWEHAYYLDYKNDRAGFLSAWFDRLVNWDFVAEQYAAAKGAGARWRYADAEAGQDVPA